jgi:hypothetical protein
MPADRPITCQALPSGSATKRVPAFDFTRNNSVCLPSLRASAICLRTSDGRLATLAQDSEDRSFWLRLSEHWRKPAQGTGHWTS